MKKPSYSKIETELLRIWNEAQAAQDHGYESMKRELINRALQRIKESEYEVVS